MKKEEHSYLDIVKQSKGVDDYSSKDEIRQFINSQKGFKLLKRENKKKDTLIKNLENKIRVLSEKLKRSVRKKSKIKRSKGITLKENSNLGKDIFLKDVLEKEEKEVKKYIKRIKFNIGDKQYTKTDIITEIMIPKKYFNKCIDILIKEDFLQKKIVNNFMRYSKK